MDQIGVSGAAGKYGIPAATVAWTGTTARSLTIFTKIDKSPAADTARGDDNNGELQNINTRNRQWKLSFSAHARAANIAAAQAIVADLPKVNDILTITCADDAQVATGSGNTTLCESASGSYTPEGEVVVDITATTWVGKALAALAAS